METTGGDFMRITIICAAVALGFVFPAAAQTPSPMTCNRAPHEARSAPSPQMMAARQAMHQACAADLAAYCSAASNGCERPGQCLKAHESQLSGACASAVQNMHAARGHGG
jgi:hypothetical protein